MKTKPTSKSGPRFAADGYEINGPTPPPRRARQRLSDVESQALGLPSPTTAGALPVVVKRGGARPGAGRKSSGKLAKQIKLSPAAIRRLQRWQRHKGLPSFSAAVEAASELVEL